MSDVILGGEITLLPDAEVGSDVQINVGQFEGVIYRYGECKFNTLPDDTIQIVMNIEVLDDNGYGDLIKNQEFIQVAGDILSYLTVCQYGELKNSEWNNFTLIRL